MEALGIPRGSYVVKVNNRKIFDGVLENIDLGGDDNAGRRLTVLRAIDKLDKFSILEVRKLLGPGRWDGGEEGKGDFAKGAGLNERQQDAVLDYFTTTTNVRQRHPTPTYHKDGEDYLIQDYRMFLDLLDLPQGRNPTSSAGIE